MHWFPHAGRWGMEGLAVPLAKRITFRVASFNSFNATALTLALVFELQWKKENSLKNLNEVIMLRGLSQQLQIVHAAKTLKSLHELSYLPRIANYLPVQNFVAFRKGCRWDFLTGGGGILHWQASNLVKCVVNTAAPVCVIVNLESVSETKKDCVFKSSFNARHHSGSLMHAITV